MAPGAGSHCRPMTPNTHTDNTPYPVLHTFGALLTSTSLLTPYGVLRTFWNASGRGLWGRGPWGPWDLVMEVGVSAPQARRHDTTQVQQPQSADCGTDTRAGWPNQSPESPELLLLRVQIRSG